MSLTDCVIVVPAFRAQNTIIDAITQIASEFEKAHIDHQILVVIDGMVDDAADLIKSQNYENVNVLEIRTNTGKGNALRHGFAMASESEYLGFIDADLDIHASGLISAYKLLKQNESLDLIVGSKLHSDSEVDYPKMRKLQSRVFVKLVNILFSFGIDDIQTGMKLGKSEIVKEMARNTKHNGFAFDLEFLMQGLFLGAKFATVPIHLNYRFTSTISPQKYIKTALEVSRIYISFLIKRVKNGNS